MANKRAPINKKRAPKSKVRKSGEQKSLLSYLLGAATLLGLLIGLTSFLPRPSLIVGDPVDPSNPFSSMFTVTNDGIIPLNDVFVGVHPEFIDVGGSQMLGSKRKPGDMDTTFTLTRPEWQHQHLSMDDKFTITLGEMFGPNGGFDFGAGVSNLRSADISIIVRYHPWFIPY